MLLSFRTRQRDGGIKGPHASINQATRGSSAADCNRSAAPSLNRVMQSWKDMCHILSAAPSQMGGRSEEHTSELQSLMRISYAVFCLKKKKKTYHIRTQDLRQHYHINSPDTSKKQQPHSTIFIYNKS